MPAQFYFDTYALVEIAMGNQKFSQYASQEFVINDLTLAEFYNIMLREYDEATADYWFRKMSPNAKPATKELLRDAVKFRHYSKGKNFSFFDAAGYIFAKQHGYKFLTGDKEFAGLSNVEFVKK